jgi:DNA-directed RNA polymerase specialized sigma24 family protein
VADSRIVPTTTTIASGPLTELFRAWQAGSRSAGDRFFRAVSGRLQRFARSVSADSDDLLQDVFLTFVENSDGFDLSAGDGAIVNWFKVTLRRRHWATAKRAGHETPTEAVELLAETGCTDAVDAVDRRLDATAQVEALRGAAVAVVPVRFHAASRARIARLADHIEAVFAGEAAPVESSGALAAIVGWTPFQLWQMSGRLELALGGASTERVASPVAVVAAAVGRSPAFAGAAPSASELSASPPAAVGPRRSEPATARPAARRTARPVRAARLARTPRLDRAAPSPGGAPSVVTVDPNSAPVFPGAEFPFASAARAAQGTREPTRAPAPSAARCVLAPEAVTSGSLRESVCVELGAGARNPSQGSGVPKPQALVPHAANATRGARPGIRTRQAGCRDGPGIREIRLGIETRSSTP